MSRTLLALLLLAGGGSPFLSASGMETLFKAVAAADGDAGNRWDPNGTPRTTAGNIHDPNGGPTTQEDPDAGSHWDPNG